MGDNNGNNFTYYAKQESKMTYGWNAKPIKGFVI